ncbi:MAG: hypothetical protein EOO15_00830 [Chitinophagaceae bacterium]|nr:MAG: hypothetical protein EOO15_00830 [Chitinophagaceae bacterium]
MYCASNDLIEILLRNGFRNKSFQYVKDYGKKYASKEQYNPYTHKREFGFGQGKQMLGFYFDYINMAVTERSDYITDQHTELSEDQLRSIIAYFKCTYAKRRSIRSYTSNKIELSGKFMREQRDMDLCDKPFDKSYEILFHTIEV